MLTAIVSDLHLGSVSGADVLRRPAVRARLVEALADVDRLVLLGDALELRESPLPDVLEAAAPVLADLAAAMSGGEIVVVPGNHDHHVVTAWMEERSLAGAGALGLEQDLPAPGWLAARLPGVSLRVAYPGVWLSDGVYATHGHYLDAHMSIPRVEALAVAAVARLTGRLPDGPRTPSDYEGVLAPIYAFSYWLAQGRTARSLGTNLSRKVWARIDARRTLRGRALGAIAIPLAVAALNRAGLGPFEGTITRQALRRSGVEAMETLVARLAIDAEHVVFGHTHRPGPLPADSDWQSPAGPRLVNTGSWLFEPGLMSARPGESPYWPGTAVFVADAGPPELRRLLQDAGHAELAPTRR